MASHLERIWSDDIHRRFIESLNAPQSLALHRLLLIAAAADDSVTDAERRAVEFALAELPAFHADDPAHESLLADCVIAYRNAPKATLAEIADALENDATRRHAFRTTVQFLQFDGFTPGEVDFVRKLGDQFGIEPEVVDFAIAAAPTIH